MGMMGGFMGQMMGGAGWPYSMMSSFWLVGLLLWIVIFWTLVDIMQRKDLNDGKRIGWVIIVLMGGFFPLSIIGALLYLMFGKR